METSYKNNRRNIESVLQRERKHHDEWAANTGISDICVEKYFEGATSPENRFIISRMGDLKGKRILDLGCGHGESSVYFALKGANCIAADISPRMVQTAMKLADKYNVRIESRTMNAMKIEFPENSFDIVYAANLLHHVDPVATVHEIFRVLKPNGKLCFWDPLKHNPVIKLYRRIAREVRSADESPLHINIIDFMRTVFSEVESDVFWLCSLWIFLQFYFIEGVNPNRERFWKKIIFEEQRLSPMYYRLEKIDKYCKRIPFIKRFAWNIAVIATK